MGNSHHIEKDQKQLENRILAAASTFSMPNRISGEKAWAIFESRASERKYAGKEVRFDFRHAQRIAAGLALLAIATFALYNFQHVEIQTDNGEFKTVTLPDQSTVRLNAGSTLEYNALTFHFARKLDFSGEGFFKVQKGSRFAVVSEHGLTQVLGTQFNLLARENRYQVSCVEGRVSVHTENSSVILTAGFQTTSRADKKLESPATFKAEVIAWQQGEFYFDAVPLPEVLKALELQYDIRIRFSGDPARTYTGYFSNKNMDEALKLVCLPLGLEYDIANDTTINIANKK